MVRVLTSLLKANAVPFPALHERYGGLLELVCTLIGAVPNCDPYLEIWPPVVLRRADSSSYRPRRSLSQERCSQRGA